MPLYSYHDFSPQISKGVFVAPSADIIGKVFLGANVNIWFGTVIRGDIQEIHIGENSNIQDLCMLHVIEELPLIIGKDVSIGHKVTLHSCSIEDSCLIGMGAVILDGAVIGKNSVVAAGAVVPPNKIYPEGSMIMGAPAQVKRELSLTEKNTYSQHFQTYIKNKNDYLNSDIFNRL